MTQSNELFSVPVPSTSIPLPEGSPKDATEKPTGKRLGTLLMFLVAILAFLLASFPARNSDVWLHLARGRLLAQGISPSSTDPDLAFELSGNQTRLYDLLCYGCYQVLGSAGLVFSKALLAAGIAILLLRTSRSTPGWCVPAICTSLALLTMSLYLQLQPATVSFFFLALVLAFLQADTSNPSGGRTPPARSILLFLLFVVWANVDHWFVLGLGVVALVWLGEVLETAFAAETSQRRWPAILIRRGLLFFVLAAACLFNPSHMQAFLLNPAAHALGSPFEGGYFARIGWGPAGLAYFFLLGLSLVSFVAARSPWRWRRFLPWLGLALLSAWQARAIPFFAVVAGPVLARNVQDFLAPRFRSPDWEAERALLQRLGQALTLILVLVLLVCAWPGWLQAPPFGPRSWTFDLAPSLERGAVAVRRWHAEGKMAAGSGGLHLSAETVHAFAWFCPGEKRLRLTEEGSADEWRQRMRSANIDYILVYDANRDRLSMVLGGLVADTEQWPLLHQEGDLAIFGWRDPDQASSADRYRSWQLNLHQLAFHPAEDKKAPPEAPNPQAATPAWWDVFWKAAPPRSIDRDEALLHLLHAEALERLVPSRHLSQWENSQVVGLIGAAAAWASPSQALSDAPFRLTLLRPQSPEDSAGRLSSLDRMAVSLQRRHALQRDEEPPTLYYLAVRAARRAVAANPEDATAYLLLGEGYLGLLQAMQEPARAAYYMMLERSLLQSTRERPRPAQLRQFLQLRQAQASAALNRALALRPDFLQAHLHLGRLYQEMGYLDLALAHWQSALRLSRQTGPPAGMNREDFQAHQAQNEEQVQRLAREVQKRADAATLASADAPTRQRAFVAVQNGLAGKALELLLESDLSAFGKEGMELELELLLGTGRPWDVQQWLRPEHAGDLGAASYYWIRARAAAAAGDYTSAEEDCAEAARAVARGPDSPQPVRLRENMAFLVATLVLDGHRSADSSLANALARVNQAALAGQLQNLAQLLRQQADSTVLRGLLALEEGEWEEAELAFRAALTLWKDKSTAASGGGLDFNGRILAQSYLRWLQ
jgi:tetratricopeptide (TPR) repeat protein